MTSPASHNKTTLVLRRVFAASRQRVFRAWITPEALAYWLRPGGQSVTVSRLEAHVGGSFCFELENGSTISGTYMHIAPPEKLIFTWSGQAIAGKETVVTLDFLDKGSETEVVLTHDLSQAPEMLRLFEGGWRIQLETLAKLLSSSHALPADPG